MGGNRRSKRDLELVPDLIHNIESGGLRRFLIWEVLLAMFLAGLAVTPGMAAAKVCLRLSKQSRFFNAPEVFDDGAFQLRSIN